MTATLETNQMELRADDDAALVIGPGTSYPWAEDGPAWWGPAAVRSADTDYAAQDGVLPGRDLLGVHTTTIVVHLLADDAADLGEKIDAWKAACAKAADTLVTVRLKSLGVTRRRVGRFRIPGEVEVLDLRTFAARASAQFVALDPITYGDDETEAMATRETPGAGFSVPFTPPFALPSSTTGGLTITNAGNRAAPWTARLDGPLAYPEVSHDQSGRRLYLSLDANGGVDLQSGEWIDIDSASRSVLLNGTADRRSNLTVDSLWWDLVPGPNDFILRADSGAGTLTVTARDAWHS